MSRLLLYEDFRGGLTNSVFGARTTPTFTVGGIADPYPVTNGSSHDYVLSAVTTAAGGARPGLTIEATANGGRYNSGMVDTRHTFAVSIPFRIEQRFICTTATAMWGTMWMTGAPDAIGSENVRGFGWPTYIELDGWEAAKLSGTPKIFYTCHGDNPYGSGPSTHWQDPSSNQVTRDVSLAYQTVAMEVDYSETRWYYNGTLEMRSTFRPSPVPWDWKWYPKLNLAVGSNIAGFVPPPDGTTPASGNFYTTDYVAVTDLNDSGRSIIALGRRGRRR